MNWQQILVKKVRREKALEEYALTYTFSDEDLFIYNGLTVVRFNLSTKASTEIKCQVPKNDPRRSTDPEYMIMNNELRRKVSWETHVSRIANSYGNYLGDLLYHKLSNKLFLFGHGALPIVDNDLDLGEYDYAHPEFLVSVLDLNHKPNKIPIWVQLHTNGPAPSPRECSDMEAIAQVGNKIYFLGANFSHRWGGTEYEYEFCSYDVRQNLWETLNTDNLPKELSYKLVASAPLNKLFACSQRSTPTTVCEFDLELHQWRPLLQLKSLSCQLFSLVQHRWLFLHEFETPSLFIFDLELKQMTQSPLNELQKQIFAPLINPKTSGDYHQFVRKRGAFLMNSYSDCNKANYFFRLADPCTLDIIVASKCTWAPKTHYLFPARFRQFVWNLILLSSVERSPEENPFVLLSLELVFMIIRMINPFEHPYLTLVEKEQWHVKRKAWLCNIQ